MAPPSVNSDLIQKRTIVLEKMGQQSQMWTLFAVISSFAILLIFLLLGPWQATITHGATLALIAVVCILWWVWSINFILRSVAHQKEIYQLLGEISTDMETMRQELITIEKSSFNLTKSKE